MTISFITQNNRRFACSFGWKDGLGCGHFSLTPVLLLPFCVYVVLCVACLVLMLQRAVLGSVSTTVQGLGNVYVAAVSHG